MRDAAVTGPVSPAPPRASEPRATRSADLASDEPGALRDRFQQAVAKRGKSPIDEPGQAGEFGNQAAMEGGLLLSATPLSKDEQGPSNRIPDAHPAQVNMPQQTPASVSPNSTATGHAGHAMDAATLAQFAERMALPASQSGRTIMTLDPSQFRVAEVTIEGAAVEGLSIMLKDHSDTKGGDHDRQESQPLETLRARLAARAIPVAFLDQA